jgi:acyl-CoA synthetase (AMP-forming)/AMP-acid ligase II
MILHRNAIATLQAASDAHGINRDDVVVCWAPPWHDLGLLSATLRAPYSATPCHLVTPAVRTIPEWFETVQRVRATLTGAPDFAFRLALRLVDPARVDLSSLRFVTNGGEPVRWSTVDAFHKTFGILMSPGYGLAEATLGVTSNRPGDPVRVDERGNVSCGTVLPGVEVRLADDGEILVRGDGVFGGYFDAEDATSETLRDGWLHTGDAGQLVDGHLYVLGRRRAMIKRGGAVIAPREVEEAAQEVEEVAVAAAVGVPRATLMTEEVVLVVELENKSSMSAEECGASVARAVERTLGFIPDRVVVVPSRTIPRTSNGKIRHALLRSQIQDGTLRV